MADAVYFSADLVFYTLIPVIAGIIAVILYLMRVRHDVHAEVDDVNTKINALVERVSIAELNIKNSISCIRRVEKKLDMHEEDSDIAVDELHKVKTDIAVLGERVSKD